MKTLLRMLSVLLIGAGGLALCAGAYGDAPPDFGLAQHFAIYGYHLPAQVQEQMRASFAPLSLDCGEVQVSLMEVLYDGRWLYTAASAVPRDPDTTLLLPGSAAVSDPVSGLYGEGEREDGRTFLAAAIADGLRLLCVYAYPAEFDQLSPYFLDHFQLADHRSVLLSGACVDARSETLSLTWAVSVYEVDPSTGEYLFLDVYEHPIEVPWLGPMAERLYVPAAEESLPLRALRLVQTGLTVYAAPEWETAEAENRYELRLLDLAGAALTPGAPPEAGTLLLDLLPEEIDLKAYDRVTGDWTAPTRFSVESER